MSLTIPNTFALRTTDIQLSDLDANFTYLATQLDTSNEAIASLQETLGVSGDNVTLQGKLTSDSIESNNATIDNTLIVNTIESVGLTLQNQLKAPGIASIDNTLQMSFNTTQQRHINVVHGFEFKNDNGVITPINKTKLTYANETSNSWTVPQGVTKIFVKMWGAGGGGGAYGGWNQGSLGGAGGFTQAIVPVVPGETITIRCGQKGLTRAGAYKAYPDGGGSATGTADARYCASGGGSSSIKVPSIPVPWCMYAGGGGGGGSVNGYSVNSGGAGGGLNGQAGVQNNYNIDGTGQNYGKGGTQTAGGAAGVGTSANNGQAGSLGQGGTFQNANPYGGGGGGGYYGGGSGAYGVNSSMGGGGGGSGYIHSSLILAQTYTGSSRVPPFSHDPDLSIDNAVQYATGGHEDGHGGPGVVIIYY